MSNVTYPLCREHMASGAFNWNTQTMTAMLVDLDQVVGDIFSFVHLDEIAAGAQVAKQVIQNRSVVDNAGIIELRGDDTTFPAVSPPPANSEAMVVYADTGDAATSPLYVYWDSATGLPITLNGADLIAEWVNGVVVQL